MRLSRTPRACGRAVGSGSGATARPVVPPPHRCRRSRGTRLGARNAELAPRKSGGSSAAAIAGSCTGCDSATVRNLLSASEVRWHHPHRYLASCGVPGGLRFMCCTLNVVACRRQRRYSASTLKHYRYYAACAGHGRLPLPAYPMESLRSMQHCNLLFIGSTVTAHLSLFMSLTVTCKHDRDWPSRDHNCISRHHEHEYFMQGEAQQKHRAFSTPVSGNFDGIRVDICISVPSTPRQ